VRNLLTGRQDSDRVAADADNDRVVDRSAQTDERTTSRKMPAFLGRRTSTDDEATQDATTRRTTSEMAAGGTTVKDRTAERVVTGRPTTTEPDTVVQPTPWAHVSGMATLSLILGVAALAATLTGLFAVEGVALGVIGGAVAAGGLVGASRRGVTGHSLAFLGLVTSLGAILLGILAITGELSWLDSKTDEVARAHNWLVAQLPWLKRW
jgi:hypothetical protein